MNRVQAAPNLAIRLEAPSFSSLKDKTSQPDAAIGQVILKLGPLPPGHWCSMEPSAQAIAAMQELMAVVEQLRSPSSGWQLDQPQTPAHLLPYVAEEAYSLLAALETSLDLPASIPLKTVDPGDLGIGWNCYGLVEQLVSPMLWAIARSAYGVMRLLEGVAADVEMEGNGDRQVGILRLAAMLHIETPFGIWVHDLVVGSGRSPHSSAMQIHVLADDWLAQPTSAHDLIQHIRHQLRCSTLHLASVLDGVNVNVLAPGQPWQLGTLKLQLGFDFVAEPLAHVALRQPNSLNSTRLAFTDSNWLVSYRDMIQQQQLSRLMPHLTGCHAVTMSSLPLPADQVLPLLVQDACDTLDLLANPLSGSAYLKLQGTLQLSDLMHQLLWSMSRSTPALMALLGGVRCALLQPEMDWQEGKIRLLVSLKIKTLGQDWFYDLATGTLPEPCVFPLAPTVVLQLHHCAWGSAPTLLQDIEAQLLQHIQTAAPELKLLLAGTNVDWLNSHGDRQPATLQLQIDFDFIPS